MTASLLLSASLGKMLEWAVKQHLTGLITAGVILLLLVAITPALPANDRPRSRRAAILALLYGLCILIPAYLATWDYQVTDAFFLGRDFLLGWSIVTLIGLIVFDFVLERWGVFAPKIVRDLTGAGLFFIVALLILQSHGVNPLSLITTSVVFTAVIGFALQDTIGNFFAGLALQVERTLAVGDWIEADGKVGRIHAIRLRSTSIVTKDGDLVALPNGVFLKGNVKNFSKPSGTHRMWMKVGVAYAHPPNDVKKVLLDCVQDLPDIEKTPAPDVVVLDFGDSSILYGLRFWIRDFGRDDLILSEVRTRAWYALKRAHIEIPFPQRIVQMTQVTDESKEIARRTELARRRDVLLSIDLFKTFDESERAELAERMRREVFAADEVIIRQGEPGDSLYVLRQGEVAVRVSGEGGAQKEVAVLSMGSFFGEMSLMTGEARTATVVAKADTVCYVLDKTSFEGILARHESLAADISASLAARRVALEAQREALSAHETAKKVQHTQSVLLSRIKNFFRLKT